MKHTLILLTGLLWATAANFAQTTTATLVKGHVAAIGTGSPIAGARIYYLPGKKMAVSQADGSFDMNINTATPVKKEDFTIQVLGYQDFNPIFERLLPYPSEYSATEADGGILTFLLSPATVQLTREVVVTAQKQASSNFKLAQSVSVIGAQALRERPARSVPEALPGATGVWLQKTNHGGGSPFVRGLTGQQTLILVDGVRLNNATFRSGPNQYLNTLDPGIVQQIEVVRGPGSVEYGSDAIGGVVNVQTSDLQVASGWHGRLDLGLASQDMEQSGAAGLSWANGGTAVQVNGAYRNFGDLVGGKGIGKQSPSGYDQWAYQAKFKTAIHPNLSLTGLWQDLQQNEVPVFHKVQLENFALNQFDPQRRQFGYLRAEGHTNRAWLMQPSLTLSWQRQQEGRQSQKNGSSNLVRELDDTRTLGLQAQAAIHPHWSPWRILNGVETYWDAVRSSRETQTGTATPVPQRGLYPDQARMASTALYSLHRFTFSKWNVDAGLRWSIFQLHLDEETLGAVRIQPSALVGNVGISYEIAPNTRLFAHANSAFRAPNVDDLGTLGIVDFRYEVPNAELRPERARTVEAGMKYRGQAFSATFSTYYTQLADLIGRVKTADSLQGYPVYLKENIGKSYITGAEAAAEWRLQKNWTAFGNVTYTYGQNTSAKEPFRRIPPAHGLIALRWQATRALALRAESVWASWQRRLSKADVDDNRIADAGTPGWAIVNLHGYFTHRWASIGLEGHNLLNEAYRMHGSGVDGLGRSVWLRVGVVF